MTQLGPYLPRDGDGSLYSQGGALYAMGLIFAGRSSVCPLGRKLSARAHV
jgi:hypothetical protein